MGFRDKVRQLKRGSPSHGMELKKRRSSQSLVVPGQVTEQSLQVWRALPAEIRHDPSMASFKMENERLHGSAVPTDDESTTPNDIEQCHDDDYSITGSEFITMKTSVAPTEKNDTKTDDELAQSDNEILDTMNSNVQQADSKTQSKKNRNFKKLCKRYGLLVFWVFAVSALMIFNEKFLLEKTLEVPQIRGKYFELKQKPQGDFNIKLLGSFNDTTNNFNGTEANYLTIQPQILYMNELNDTAEYMDILDPWYLPLVAEELLDVAPAHSRNRTYQMPDEVLEQLNEHNTKMRLFFSTNIQQDIAVKLTYNPLIINVKTGTILAALILLLFNSLLVWEVFERPFIAIVCSTLSIAVCACFDDRPNMEEIIQWMDMELLTLLFSMMILVCILTETGVFDYIAVFAFEISGGKIWPMIYSLCFITCFVSSFLDNMTTVLLLTPVAIRLCEVMSLDPVPVLMGIIVHSNIGGSLTPIGDPISIIICSNHYIMKNGVTFMKFVAHTLPGVILTAIQSCIYLRFIFRKMDSLRLTEPKEIKELRREIKVWQRAANSVAACSKDADLVRATLLRRVKILKHTLRHKLRGIGSPDAYVHTLEDLKLKYPIKNKKLLLQASCSLAFVIICFFIQSVPHLRTLPLGWVALLGVIALLIILNRDDMEHLMHRIEWTTLLFFAAMFVMMECVERLGLFTWIGELTENIILLVDKRNRLAVALFIILWFSGLASAFLDSIPVTAMMVKVVVSLVAKDTLGLPLEPLVWALAFGPCLGGNGTLYGASSNVISAGIAEQHGYKISFTRYLRIAFPMMLGQITIITAYLFVAHIVFEWH